MGRKYLYLFVFVIVLFTPGCVKETYNMNELSGKMHLFPTLSISAVRGNISFSDMVKASDTVVFDQNKFVKVVFRKDSAINLKLADFYDFDNMLSFSQSYTIGDLSLSPFQGNMVFTLDQISQRFAAALRNQFVALNDGALHPFPAFPSTNLGERTFPVFGNFQNAVFSSGFLDILITNNLTAPLSSININLYNTSGHTAIGNTLTFTPIQPGQTQSVSLDLTGKTLTNSIIAAVVLSGSTGNPNPVLISLANNNIQIALQGRNLKVKSGRVMLPPQTISTLDNKDTLTFNPGSGIELEKMKIITGNVSYHVRSTSSLYAALDLSMPTVLRNGSVLTQVINVGPVSQFDGTIQFSNTVSVLNSDVKLPYNRIPVEYTLNVNSNNTIINFNSTDKVQLDMKLLNPDFDYIKGYFGQQAETLTPDTIDLGIEDVLKHITGNIHIADPSIRFDYSNSFAFPIEVNLNGSGKRNNTTVSLGLAPFILNYPAALTNRDISSSFTIDKTNSSISQLVSLPPGEIIFSGSARMNPSGDVNHLRNNYLFGNSRILGSLEVQIPLEFSLNNIQFADTVDNFLQSDEGDSDNPVKPENFSYLRIDINAKNGFPLGVSVKMSLYDPVTHSVKSTVNASNILKPAATDNSGKANGITESNTSIEFTKEFFSSIKKSDKIIFYFSPVTTGDGTKDVKIYSDYKIDFHAAFVIKPDIVLN